MLDNTQQIVSFYGETAYTGSDPSDELAVLGKGPKTITVSGTLVGTLTIEAYSKRSNSWVPVDGGTFDQISQKQIEVVGGGEKIRANTSDTQTGLFVEIRL